MSRGMLGGKHEGMMSAQRDALITKLAEKEEALHMLLGTRAGYANYAEVGGDWSKTEATLRREISDLKAQISTADDDDASRA
jgi:hypothetical protein